MLRTHSYQTVSPVAREARFSFLPVLFGADCPDRRSLHLRLCR